MRRLAIPLFLTLILTLAMAAPSFGQSSPAPSDRKVVVPPPPPRPGSSSGDRVEPTPAPRPVVSAPADRAGGTIPPATFTATIVSGTPLPVRVIQYIDSEKSDSGDTFQALLEEDIKAGDQILIPRGTVVVGRLENVLRGGRVNGRAEMTLVLQEMDLETGPVPITSNPITVRAGSSKGKDARTVAIASGIGAAIGVIFGGKKGAAVGAAAGAGAGAGRVLTSRGKAARVEREQLLTFQLEEDTQVQVRSN